MVVSSREEALLEQAILAGVVRAEDVAVARAAAVDSRAAVRRGPVLDRLIDAGKLTDSSLELLASRLAAPPPARLALAQTLAGDDPSLEARPTAASSPAFEATLPSEVGPATAAAAAVDLGFPAPHWDRYEFLEVLGRGGMGAVYRARDRRLGRPVALKFIHGQDPGLVQRFLQEARAQARLEHPNICKVYEVGSVDGKPYIAMELVAGQTLDRVCTRLSLDAKLQLVKSIAEALHAAHEQGIIHRDIKPSTVPIVGKLTSTFPASSNASGELALSRNAQCST